RSQVQRRHIAVPDYPLAACPGSQHEPSSARSRVLGQESERRAVLHVPRPGPESISRPLALTTRLAAQMFLLHRKTCRLAAMLPGFVQLQSTHLRQFGQYEPRKKTLTARRQPGAPDV